MSSLSLDEKLSTVTSIAEATTPTPQNIDLYAVDFCPINVASCGYRVHAVGQYCPPHSRPPSLLTCASLRRFAAFSKCHILCNHCGFRKKISRPSAVLCTLVTPPARPAIAERSIVISLCVCLSAIIPSELHVRSSPIFLCMLATAVARYSSGGVVIRYILPVCG